jgi:methylmalonyl-CoA mutase cobalamin-binding subunit
MDGVFGPGTVTEDIVAFIEQRVKDAEQAR